MEAEQPTWNAVDEWIEAQFVGADSALDEALVASDASGLPAIAVSPAQGRLLELLVRMSGARNVLEVGTLGGYSTIWLARGLPPGGRVVTLELDPHHAEVARANLERAGLGDIVEVIVGPAAQSLPELIGPFDLVFIDADKPSTPSYFAQALRLSRPGTVIVVDNVVRGGEVADPDSREGGVPGIRAFADLVAADPSLRATAIQTVGRKGYDGFAVVLVGDQPQGTTSMGER